jgi:tetratricopeptide (TPR) repeat protein
MNDANHAELARIRDQIERGQYDEALQSVISIQAIVEGTAGAQTFLLRGLALAGMAQPDRAERSFRTAYSIVRYAPTTDATAQRLLAEAAEHLGLRAEALAAYHHVLAAVPGDAKAKAAVERLSGERRRRASAS